MNMICDCSFFCLLDLEEQLFRTRERMIEISIEKDNLFDSVSGLEQQLYLSRKNFRKLRKQFFKLKRVHKKCSCRNIVLFH